MAPEPSDLDVRQLILRRVRPGVGLEDLHDDCQLGESGAGLDSISLVELLMDCEAAFEISLPDSLLDRGAVTVGDVRRGIAVALGAAPER